MENKIEYAQLLNDGSEIQMMNPEIMGTHHNMSVGVKKGSVALILPIQKPNVTVPVIELFLK
jgi:alpha-L-fucosidase